MDKHTPTPWHLDNEGRTVVGADGIQICTPHGLRNPQPFVNAAFIVRAVNMHEELLAVSKSLIAFLQEPMHKRAETELEGIVLRMHKAIAKAEGRQYA